MNRYLNYRRIAIILCLSLLIPHFLFLNTIWVEAASTGTVTATSVFVRSGPGTTYSKVQVNGADVYIKNGDTVNILDEKDGWYNISTTFGGKTVKGYVSSDYIKADKVTEETPTKTPTKTPTVTPIPPAENSNGPDFKLPGKVIATSLNVRKTASSTSSKMGSITNGKVVTILNEVVTSEGKWYRISYVENKKTITGYVLSDYTQLTLDSRIKANVSSKSKIKLRQTASDKGKYITTAAGTVISLNNNKSITITKEVKDAAGQKWFYVYAYIGEVKYSGYILASNVKIRPVTVTPTVAPTKAPTKAPAATPTPPTENGNSPGLKLPGKVIATNLNVRKTTSTTGSIVASIKNGTAVTVLNEVVTSSGKWYGISFVENKKTITGYVLSDFIELTLKSKVKANVNSKTKINLKKTASDTGKNLATKDGTVITLKNNKSITITKEVKDGKGQKWFYVYAYIGEVKYSGYILANNALIRPVTVTPTEVPTETPTKAPTKAPTSTPTITPTIVPTITPMPEINTSTEAVINKDGVDIYLNVFGGLNSLNDIHNNPIKLNSNYSITIYSTVTETDMYYFVGFVKESKEYHGYVKAENVKIGTVDVPSTGVPPTDIPSTGVPPTGVPPTPTKAPIPTGALTPAQFEKSLETQGFPESYKAALRNLHAQYPNWIFEAYHTGLDWNTVIEKEGKVGINLISNGKSNEWKSFETGAYNWKTDKFIPFDGSTWMTVSKEGLGYYMDPRNFLDEKSIFQFELLEYKSGYQNAVGVEGILYNTPLYNKTYTYVNDNGKVVNISYGETFIKAAEYTGVSPYHLASRVKQEVVTGTTTLSNSVSGTVSGYENLYNFYNIGAYHSTAPGGAVINGLKYAANGSTDMATNASLLIPWTSPYRSIVGGAYSIGQNYIKRGQNTIYLQKFNVTPKSTFTHQYMANVEAPFAEAKKVYAGYSTMMDAPIVFSIPVFLNMPEQAVPVPTTVLNPNNWLKTLAVDDFKITPTFNVTNPEQVYTLIVDNSVEVVNISATTVSSKASVFGTGYIPLEEGLNEVEIEVIAETGDIKIYTIYITRE